MGAASSSQSDQTHSTHGTNSKLASDLGYTSQQRCNTQQRRDKVYRPHHTAKKRHRSRRSRPIDRRSVKRSEDESKPDKLQRQGNESSTATALLEPIQEHQNIGDAQSLSLPYPDDQEQRFISTNTGCLSSSNIQYKGHDKTSSDLVTWNLEHIRHVYNTDHRTGNSFAQKLP